MQRYLYPSLLELHDRIYLNDQDNHHLVNVMRSKVGQKIELVDCKEESFIGIIILIHEGLAEIELISEVEASEVELPIQVIIACGLSKGDKLDWIVQKSTECGASSFIPLAMERDVVKWNPQKANDKIKRLQKIAKEAAEQCYRRRILEIQPIMTLTDLISEQKADYKAVAYEELAKEGTHSQLKTLFKELQIQDKLLFVFGSEGGISPTEIDQLIQADFRLCSLGPRILRAETAPIYLLNALSYHFEL